jgi:hypothetical protein
MTDDDEAEYYRREQARFSFFKRIESLQQHSELERDSEKPASESFSRGLGMYRPAHLTHQ